MLKKLHHRFVYIRRTKVLSRELSAFIGQDTKKMLDIGCGDGAVSKLIRDNNPLLDISGIDILERPYSAIPVKLYDGRHIPYEDNSVDMCFFADVLHHLPHIKELLTEAMRVSCRYILIKDHLYKSEFDFKTLKFMDDAGNKLHGVHLEYNYLKEEEWSELFKNLGLIIEKTKTNIPLYPFPFNLIFGRRLHFISLLKIEK
jgi:SAM-dependent methyltransferase